MGQTQCLPFCKQPSIASQAERTTSYAKGMAQAGQAYAQQCAWSGVGWGSTQWVGSSLSTGEESLGSISSTA